MVERAAPTMFVADTSTLGVVADWARRRPGDPPLVPARGDGGAGIHPLDGSLPGRRRRGRRGADDVFAVISTAAVDVVPRGAALTHANVLTANLTAIAAFGFTAGDRYLLALPLFHVTALGTALAHLHAGPPASSYPASTPRWRRD